MADVKVVVDATTGESVTVPLTPEEQAALDADRAAGAKQQAATRTDAAAGAERLTLIAERAAEDPAYAALAREVGVI